MNLEELREKALREELQDYSDKFNKYAKDLALSNKGFILNAVVEYIRTEGIEELPVGAKENVTVNNAKVIPIDEIEEPTVAKKAGVGYDAVKYIVSKEGWFANPAKIFKDLANDKSNGFEFAVDKNGKKDPSHIIDTVNGSELFLKSENGQTSIEGRLVNDKLTRALGFQASATAVTPSILTDLIHKKGFVSETTCRPICNFTKDQIETILETPQNIDAIAAQITAIADKEGLSYQDAGYVWIEKNNIYSIDESVSQFIKDYIKQITTEMVKVKAYQQEQSAESGEHVSISLSEFTSMSSVEKQLKKLASEIGRKTGKKPELIKTGKDDFNLIVPIKAGGKVYDFKLDIAPDKSVGAKDSFVVTGFKISTPMLEEMSKNIAMYRLVEQAKKNAAEKDIDFSDIAYMVEAGNADVIFDDKFCSATFSLSNISASDLGKITEGILDGTIAVYAHATAQAVQKEDGTYQLGIDKTTAAKAIEIEQESKDIVTELLETAKALEFTPVAETFKQYEVGGIPVGDLSVEITSDLDGFTINVMIDDVPIEMFAADNEAAARNALNAILSGGRQLDISRTTEDIQQMLGTTKGIISYEQLGERIIEEFDKAHAPVEQVISLINSENMVRANMGMDESQLIQVEPIYAVERTFKDKNEILTFANNQIDGSGPSIIESAVQLSDGSYVATYNLSEELAREIRQTKEIPTVGVLIVDTAQEVIIGYEDPTPEHPDSRVPVKGPMAVEIKNVEDYTLQKDTLTVLLSHSESGNSRDSALIGMVVSGVEAQFDEKTPKALSLGTTFGKVAKEYNQPEQEAKTNKTEAKKAKYDFEK